MKICVYGAASNIVDQLYVDKTEELGRLMAKRGHTLVYGAGNCGMMGAISRGVDSAGGNIIGIVPKFFKDLDVVFDKGRVIYTETMRQRKRKMEEMSDGFIMTPGGIGTFDEYFEMLTLRTLDRHLKPIVVYNINGYYDALEAMLDNAIEGKFMTKYVKELTPFFTDPEKLLDYLENYKGVHVDINDIKHIKKP